MVYRWSMLNCHAFGYPYQHLARCIGQSSNLAMRKDCIEHIETSDPGRKPREITVHLENNVKQFKQQKKCLSG